MFGKPRPAAFAAFSMASTPAPDQNVVGIGVGEQIAGDMPTGLLAVKFYVRVKFPKHELSKKDLLPKSIDGLPVDVEQTGLFRRLAKKKPSASPSSTMPNPKARARPAQPGCSVGFEFGSNPALKMAGTYGALVRDSGGLYVLSNNHVLADEGRLKAGVPIFQPGLLDGGSATQDKIAELSQFVPFETSGNSVDAAIAKVSNKSLVSREVLHIGAPGIVENAAIDMMVHKFGRTTNYTVGRVTSIETDVSVGYDTGNFIFHDQIVIVGSNGKPFSASGDSGSLILQRGTNKAVGLLFAGSSSHTLANHLSDVLKAFKVTMA
jgi:hypothetical protein